MSNVAAVNLITNFLPSPGSVAPSAIPPARPSSFSPSHTARGDARNPMVKSIFRAGTFTAQSMDTPEIARKTNASTASYPEQLIAFPGFFLDRPNGAARCSTNLVISLHAAQGSDKEDKNNKP
ncbi:MAG: hypothetical protein WCF68_10840 [Terriglobales bacterium]